MKSIVLCAVTLLLLQHALTLAFSDADVEDEVDELGGRYRRARRGWSMMRLGRGLQMLRLGKRTAPSPPSHVPQASPEKMRELLGALLEEGGQEYRRQPPMPRYGRDLDEEEEEEVLEELLDLLREMQPKSRHASRFMRSADDARIKSGEDSTSDSAKQSFSSGS